jgi:hypothetical protein
MEKKEKSEVERILLKKNQMNKNMFNFIKTIPGVTPEMELKNQLDPKNPEKFIPDYDINGTSTTNKEFKFKIIILPEEDFQVIFIINDDIKFKLSNNSQLRFVLESYLVTEKIKATK